jgi:hypothetical protein
VRGGAHSAEKTDLTGGQRHSGGSGIDEVILAVLVDGAVGNTVQCDI